MHHAAVYAIIMMESYCLLNLIYISTFNLPVLYVRLPFRDLEFRPVYRERGGWGVSGGFSVVDL